MEIIMTTSPDSGVAVLRARKSEGAREFFQGDPIIMLP